MNDRNSMNLSASIRKKALSLGFDICGIASVRILTEYEDRLQSWCEKGMNDKMGYLCRQTERRANPELLIPGVKSLIVTGLNYYTDKIQKYNDVPVISRYALGKDYHGLITAKLDELLLYIKSVVPETTGKSFSDSAPLLEKPWAVQAGLGWQGRHSIVINNKIGSFFFIGILAVSIELEYDAPYKNEQCGECRICIDECPVNAINEDRTIDARKCISNLTIENRGPVPEDKAHLFGNRIYGCDICQEVCPWNKHVKPHSNDELSISDSLANLTRSEWETLTKEKFVKIFGGTPVERVGFERFSGNLKILLRS